MRGPVGPVGAAQPPLVPRVAIVRVLLFGTYDMAAHPRVAVLAEGLQAHGVEVIECNAPLGLDTAARVSMLRQPWRLPHLAWRLAACWWRLRRQARRAPRPDAVLVGYLGHFDVHLARRLFPDRPVVLDHLLFAGDTARDRGETGGVKQALLRRLDQAALAAADVVLVDTEEHRGQVPGELRHKSRVVAVGAPQAWLDAGARASAEGGDGGGGAGSPPLRVVFFGLYTPLQGAPVMGRALARLAGADIDVTMIGTGQDLAETRTAAAGNPRVRWLDWVPGAQLPELVAHADVCLGVFGTGPKALRVVPNKVYQGLAAGCVVVTSDTSPQRRALGEVAVLVPPGDDAALAEALRALAADRGDLARRRSASLDLARQRYSPAGVVDGLLDELVARVGAP